MAPDESLGPAGGNGDVIVATLAGQLGDGVDATSVTGLAVSDDGGHTWQRRAVPDDLVEALSVAVLADGTVFVSTGLGPLLRMRPGGEATVVRSLMPLAVAADGNALYALDRERILVSRDHGRRWQPVSLAG